jgi:uncharacterized protein
MLRAVALSLFALSPSLLAADCVGESLAERLSADQAAALATAAESTVYGRGLGWIATRDGAQVTVIGTMHLSDPRHADLVERFAPAVKEADLLLVEATEAEVAALQTAIATDPNLIFNQTGPTLPELLDEATWDGLSDALRARGIPPVLASKMQPWFLMVTLGMPPCAMDQIIAQEPGLDFLLVDIAQASGVPQAPLEPWDTLFGLISAAPQDEQLEMLKFSLMDEGLQQELYVAMLDGYFAEEVAEIWELSRIAMAFVPDLPPAEGEEIFALMEQALLTERNANWIPVIEQAATEHDRIVVAVGAAHLPGEGGVLRLMENAGWTIAPAP